MEETIRDRIKRLCREHGITAAQLERTLGFGNGYISKMDKSIPSTAKVQRIADYFELPIEYILTGDDDTIANYVYENDIKATDTGYYHDERTAQIAQAIYDNKALSLLFDEARDASVEDLVQTYSLLRYLKKKERGGED